MNKTKIPFLRKPLVQRIIKEIKFVAGKPFNGEYLKNLQKISVEQFNHYLQILQKNIQSGNIYKFSFVNFLKEFIYLVFEVIMLKSQRSNQTLPELQKRLLKDMKEFTFVS